MKICLDAGHNHSNFDTGASGHGLCEQDVTYSIVKKLQTLLENIGVEVILTRAYNEQNLGTDTNSSLRKRVETCNFHNCDYFVSIHCNSHCNCVANGTEVLISGRGGKAEELATHIQHCIVDKLKTENRGVKVSPMYVLRNTDCPAVLVETAFISNKSDNLLLKTRQDDFSQAIFEGICKQIGIVPSKELQSVNDIVWELANRGIITNKELWLQKLNEDRDSYWLAMKSANYIRGIRK